MKADHDPGWAAGPEVLAANSTVSQDSVERLLRSCLLRLPRRSVPPGWSRSDWQQEVEQVVALAMMRALHDFHPAPAEDPERFVFRRVDSEVRNRQRREWAFGRRSQAMVPDSHPGTVELSENDATGRDLVVGQDYLYDELQQAILRLPERQRRVIVLLFFEDLTEALAAQKLDLGQPAVNRLKRAGLGRLRKYLCGKGLAVPAPISGSAPRNSFKMAA
jgi:RNA polymerase sigma factor (sigma-70 family)